MRAARSCHASFCRCRNTRAPPSRSMDAHPFSCRRPDVGLGSTETQPVRIACRSAGASATPVSAPRISSARSPLSTRSSRGSSRTAIVAARGEDERRRPERRHALEPHRRGTLEPGDDAPAQRCSPARPASASSAVSVRTPRHASVSWSCTCAKSLNGTPGSVGSVTPRAAQADITSAQHPTSNSQRPTRGRVGGFLEVGCWKLGVEGVPSTSEAACCERPRSSSRPLRGRDRSRRPRAPLSRRRWPPASGRGGRGRRRDDPG